MGRFVGVETDEVLTLLQEVAEEVINPRFRSLDDDQITEKNPGDLVTVADREAEVLITAALQAAYPDALILGEEATHADKTADRPLPTPPTTPSPSTRSTARRTSSRDPRTTR